MIVELPPNPAISGPATAGGLEPARPRTARLAFANLTPDADATERRFARVFARTAHRVSFVPLGTDGPEVRDRPWTEAHAQAFDGLLITSAPLEGRPFESVEFWPGLVRLFDWATACGVPALFVGWAAQAVLHHRHGIEPSPLPAAASGIVEQEVLASSSPYLAGVGRRFSVPVVRRTKVRWAALAASRGLTALATSTRAGLSLIEEPATRSLMLFDHLEFEAGDVGVSGSSGADWGSAASLLFGNWLDQAMRHCRAAA